jgi:Resolvase, N terminal domain
MGDRKAVGYFRISGKDGALMRASLEERRQALRAHVESGGMRLVEECVDYENGKRSGRPQFTRALGLCKAGPVLLVIPKAGPLAKDPTFFVDLHVAGVDFAVLDMPQLNRATLLSIGQAAHLADARRITAAKRA